MPGVYFGPYDERNQDYANAGNANLGNYPLGHTLIIPDGREYKYTLNDGTVEVAGNLYQSVAPVDNHTDLACDVARAVDAIVISATSGATLGAVDIYTEGTIHVDAAPGEGYAYAIARARTAGAAHAAWATNAVATMNLAAGEQVQVALTTASDVTLTRNSWHQPLLAIAPPTAGLSGVSPGVAAADRFYWQQVRGYAAIFVDGTLIVGQPVMASIGTTGRMESYKRRIRTTTVTALQASTTPHMYSFLLDHLGTTTLARLMTTVTGTFDISGPAAANAPITGQCIKVNDDGEYGLVDLALSNPQGHQ